MKERIPEWLVILLFSLALAGCGSAPQKLDNATPSAVAPPAASTQPAPTVSAPIGIRRPTAPAGAANPNLSSLALLLAASDERTDRLRELFVQAASSPTTTVTVAIAEGEAAKQKQQVADALKAGAQVLVIQPVDQDASAAYVDAAHKAGARVIALDRLVNTRDLDGYVSFDNFGIGQAQANQAVSSLTANKVKTPWNFVLLEGPAGDSVAAELTRGYYDVLKSLIDKKQVVVAADQAHSAGSSEQAAKTVSDALNKTNNNLAAILANNSALARGALQALDTQKLVGKVFVAGAGADMDTIRAVCAGQQGLASVLNVKPLAESAARLAVALAHGRSAADTGLSSGTLAVADRQVPLVRVAAPGFTLDTAQQVLIQSGLYAPADIGKCTPPLADGAAVPQVSATGKLTLWSQEDPDLIPYLANLAGQFGEANPGVRIQITNLDADGLRAGLQPTSTLTLPDLLWIPGDTVADLASRGALQPTDDLVDASVFLTPTYAAAAVQDKHYGVPLGASNFLLLYYNKKLLKEPPADTAALTRLASTQSKADGSQWTLVYNLTEPSYFLPWLTGLKGSLFATDGHSPALTTTAMVDTLTFLKGLRDQKVIPPEADGATADSLFRQGKAALAVNGDWAYEDYAAALGDNLGVARLPRLAKTLEYPHGSISGYFLAFGKDLSGDRLTVAKAFAQFLTSRAIQLDMAKKWKRLPALRDALTDAVIANDPYLKPAADQAQVDMPLVSTRELRCVWDALRPNLAPLLAGKATPADTAKAMQDLANACVNKQ